LILRILQIVRYGLTATGLSYPENIMENTATPDAGIVSCRAFSGSYPNPVAKRPPKLLPISVFILCAPDYNPIPPESSV
jgi:hypothetical protein